MYLKDFAGFPKCSHIGRFASVCSIWDFNLVMGFKLVKFVFIDN
jgi:hypothetical protein